MSVFCHVSDSVKVCVILTATCFLCFPESDLVELRRDGAAAIAEQEEERSETTAMLEPGHLKASACPRAASTAAVNAIDLRMFARFISLRSASRDGVAGGR